MPVETDSLNTVLPVPALQQNAYEYPVAETDTFYAWNLPDSIVNHLDTVHYCKSIFTEHLLPANKDFETIQRDGSHNIFTGISILVLLLMAITFVFQRRKITLLLQSLFSKRMAGQFLRESKIFGERIYLDSMLIYTSVQSMLLVLLVTRFAPSLIEGRTLFAVFAFSFLLVAADHYVKSFFALSFANLFEYQSQMNIFKINKFFYLTFISFILFPLVCTAFYTGANWPLWIYLPCFIISYIMMIFNTITLNLGKINWSLFFLYFCTVEILPYAVLWKFVQTLTVV